MIWAETNLVGCAVTLCKDISKPKHPNVINTLCLYRYLYTKIFSTKGNVNGKPIYKIGPGCSDSGCKCNSIWPCISKI